MVFGPALLLQVLLQRKIAKTSPKSKDGVIVAGSKQQASLVILEDNGASLFDSITLSQPGRNNNLAF